MILYPYGAQYVLTGQRNIIRFDSLYPPLIMIIMVKPANGQTLDQVGSQLENQMTASGLSVISSEQTTVANNPGYRMYVPSPDGQFLSILEFTIFNDGLQFQMEQIYLQNNTPIMQQVEASFEISQLT